MSTSIYDICRAQAKRKERELLSERDSKRQDVRFEMMLTAEQADIEMFGPVAARREISVLRKEFSHA